MVILVGKMLGLTLTALGISVQAAGQLARRAEPNDCDFALEIIQSMDGGMSVSVIES